ncbi:MAG: DUF5069 domain-containing protein [Verrucomicrobiota bacterium]
MKNYSWDTTFVELFNRCLARYMAGDIDFENYYTEADLEFLDSIGYQKREFFDFVEDLGDGGEPSLTTAVMIASVRRDYLHHEMDGEKSSDVVRPEDLPARDARLEGVAWLPRIIAKAKGKLRGELDPDIMYGCGGDRAFLSRHNIAPADFLRAVYSLEGDEERIAAYVRESRAG